MKRCKIVLVGYPGSQIIASASQYLNAKYLPEFDKIYLNYKGPIEGWAKHVAGFLEYLTDDTVIFSLDDYLVAGVDRYQLEFAQVEIGGDVVCVKLCKSTSEEHAEYPVTTQYCLWNREYLIWLLNQVQTPWQFEIDGSKIFNKKVLLRTCIDYNTNSSLSGRWQGVNLDGLKEEDLTYIKTHGLIK